MTTLAEERAEQKRWKPRGAFAGLDFFDRLVENEFMSPAGHDAAESRALAAIVQFAALRVPYYRSLFARLNLGPEQVASRRDLARLPLLTKRQLREEFENLRPDALPPGTAVWGIAESSGSTGPPTRVVHSTASNLMFTYLNQRQTRWFRRDPGRTLAWIRMAENIPPAKAGALLADGESLRMPRWPHVGALFETGPSVHFNVTNPVEMQVQWLRRERPDYLLTRSHSLVHLALAAGGVRPCASLLAVTAISEVMTSSTRRYLEAAFGAPVQQGYGLNEIGLVAVRCNAGRYHVHSEHCVVEIIDAAGMPCTAGRAGRLVVTGLQNFAMPLIRYDSDDLVTAVEGPCPCGRTLPSFGEIHGRCSRIVPLPPGTLERVGALRTALQQMPAELGRDLRRYQIRQFRDASFELWIVAAAALPKAFHDRIARDGSAAAGPPLRIREVAEIPLDTTGDKFDDFVSEFMPQASPGGAVTGH